MLWELYVLTWGSIPEFPRIHNFSTDKNRANAKTKVSISETFVKVLISGWLHTQNRRTWEKSMTDMYKEKFQFTSRSTNSKKKLKHCLIIRVSVLIFFKDEPPPELTEWEANWTHLTCGGWGAFWPLGGVLSALAVIDRQGGGGKGLGSAAQCLWAYYHVQPVREAKGTHTHTHIHVELHMRIHIHTYIHTKSQKAKNKNT